MWIREGSSLPAAEDAFASPPTTNTLPWAATIAWPDLGVGAGPIFWNMYHRWSDISFVPGPLLSWAENRGRRNKERGTYW